MADSTLKLLVVEDNPGDVRLLREYLAQGQARGSEVFQAGRLSQAMQLLAQNTVDAVLLDLGLPDSQGLDTFRRIHEYTPQTPILLLTGLDDMNLAVEAMQAGAEDYLVKGHIGEYSLLRSIRYAIERKRVQAVLKQYSEQLEEMVAQRTAELRRTQDELLRQEKLAVLGRLAGGMGHELRNPLGVIANAVYYLRRRLESSDLSAMPDVLEYVDRIHNETRQAEKIIADLLDFARPVQPVLQMISVVELAALALRSNPAPASIKARVQVRADTPSVYVDPHHIVQALGNLLVNAYQAMPDGGQVTLSAWRNDNQVVIAMQDNGPGIPPEHQAHLFEPLFTTKSRGIGLGLATARKLVEASAGCLEVTSEMGQGSTVNMRLPAFQESTRE